MRFPRFRRQAPPAARPAPLPAGRRSPEVGVIHGAVVLLPPARRRTAARAQLFVGALLLASAALALSVGAEELDDLGAAAASASAVPAAVAVDAEVPAPTSLVLRFSKQDADGDRIWHGRVEGDLRGTLQTELLAADFSQPLARVAFRLRVEAGADPFTAQLAGTLNPVSGRVRLSGVVTEGRRLGDPIAWRGQLVNTATSHFEGTFSVASAESIAAADAADPARLQRVAAVVPQGAERRLSLGGEYEPAP